MERTPAPLPAALIAAAVALAALAGFVDALVFCNTGFFAAFLSGDTTRLGVGLGSAGLGIARVAGGLILSFLSGVVAASVLGRAAGPWRHAGVMGAVTLLILAAAALARWRSDMVPALLLAGAMGMQTGVFAHDAAAGLSSLTGALVRLGQRLAAALMGEGPAFGWVPDLLLWAGFVAGAVLGTRSYQQIGLDSLWAAAGLALVMTVVLTQQARGVRPPRASRPTPVQTDAERRKGPWG